MGYAMFMRKSRSVCLVLLAGGVAVSLAGGCESRQAQLQRECAAARAEMRPDAEQICARSVSRSYSSAGGGGHGWWFFGRSGGSSSTRTASAFSSGRSGAAATSSRGGFGGTASAHGGASS